MSTENEWAWCNKCQMISYFPNQSSSVCPAGGQHNGNGSFNYTLTYTTSGGNSSPPPGGTSISVDFRSVANGNPGPIVPVDPLGAGITLSGYKGNGNAWIGYGPWSTLLQNLAPQSCRVPLRWAGGNPGIGAGGAQTSGDAHTWIADIKAIGAIPYAIYLGDSSDNGGINGTDAGNFVHYFNDNGGQNSGPVNYWVIGNEPENTNDDGGYESVLAGILSAMHGASSVKCSAPAASYWDSGFIQTIAQNYAVDILSYHAYDAGDGPPPGSDGFPQASQYYSNIKTMQGFKGGILYGVEEFNWSPGGAGPQNWENTVWIADVYGQTMSAGGHAIMYADSNGPLGLINDGTGQGQPGSFLTTMPAYWGVGIWTGMNGQFSRYSNNFVPASSTFANNTLTVYATDNGKIVIINKDTSSHAVTIGMGGVASGTYNIFATQQGNPTGAIQQVVTNGSYSNQIIDYTVPAGTAVSVDVSF